MAKNHPKKPTDNDATVRFPAIHYKLSADISTIPSEFPPDLHCKADAMSSCLVFVLLSLITLFISCINLEKKWRVINYSNSLHFVTETMVMIASNMCNYTTCVWFLWLTLVNGTHGGNGRSRARIIGSWRYCKDMSTASYTHANNSLVHILCLSHQWKTMVEEEFHG
jgi:hypothetical protein